MNSSGWMKSDTVVVYNCQSTVILRLREGPTTLLAQQGQFHMLEVFI